MSDNPDNIELHLLNPLDDPAAIEIAARLCPEIAVDRATGHWFDAEAGVSGIGAEALLAHAVRDDPETDPETAIGFLRFMVAREMPGVMIEASDVGPNADALRLKFLDD